MITNNEITVEFAVLNESKSAAQGGMSKAFKAIDNVVFNAISNKFKTAIQSFNPNLLTIDKGSDFDIDSVELQLNFRVTMKAGTKIFLEFGSEGESDISSKVIWKRK